MYKDRTLMIHRFIDDEAANSIISILLYLRKESMHAPISIYLNVPGGWLRPSLALYDLIQNTQQHCEVRTCNLGLCAGMGAMLCAAGTKGQRAAMPNSRFVLSRTGMDKVFRGQATDIALEVKNNKLWNNRMESELSGLTNQPLEKIQQDMKRDYFLSSDEAVQYGLIDQVLLPSPLKRATRGERVADLGAFDGGDEQRFQKEPNQGGWGSRQPTTVPTEKKDKENDDDDDDGPKIAKG
jgi:ATP-dependent Clp protease protease subunit